jgi:ribosomal protein S18 acetylase RimI-like enzyme
MTNYLYQPLTPEDLPLMRRMLYLAIHVPAGVTPPPPEIVASPDLAAYVNDWGRAGDMGLKAIDTHSGQVIGAAWLRLFAGEAKGYGYVDGETPELSIALSAPYRGKGIGTQLLGHLFEAAGDRYKAVSLSVSADNPALRLYERLGFEPVGKAGTSLTMKKDLQPLITETGA